MPAVSCIWDNARRRLWPRGLPHRSRVVVERLHEKVRKTNASPWHSGANRGCFPPGHHDHFSVGRYLVEPRLDFQAACLWHRHIEHGQRHRMAAGVREKTSASSKLSAISPSESSSCSIFEAAVPSAGRWAACSKEGIRIPEMGRRFAVFLSSAVTRWHKKGLSFRAI